MFNRGQQDRRRETARPIGPQPPRLSAQAQSTSPLSNVGTLARAHAGSPLSQVGLAEAPQLPGVADCRHRDHEPTHMLQCARPIHSASSAQSNRGEGSFGARFVYDGPAEVIITVDRSQWILDVASQPDTEPWPYDLLVATHAGRAYSEVFPEASPLVPGERYADQLPDGVSWRATLSAILAWVATNGVQRLVDRARRERSTLMPFGRPPG